MCIVDEKVEAPKDYEDLIRVIHDRYDGMSKSYQTIALYLTQNPNDVAVRSVNSIGDSSGVHASSFVRFAQALGYEGFKDLQTEAAFQLVSGHVQPCRQIGDRQALFDRVLHDGYGGQNQLVVDSGAQADDWNG
jgi:DNA-binding MurR/RpiR family transcriptional regulator